MTLRVLPRVPTATLLLALGLLPCPAVAQERPPLEVVESAAETVRELAAARSVVEAFHVALAAGDSAGALARLHPEVVIYEAGHAETLAEYRAGHLAADMEFAGGVESRPVQVTDWIDGDVAVILRESRVRGTFRDRTIDSITLETTVLEKTHDGWRIRHIHWSSRPHRADS